MCEEKKEMESQEEQTVRTEEPTVEKIEAANADELRAYEEKLRALETENKGIRIVAMLAGALAVVLCIFVIGQDFAGKRAVNKLNADMIRKAAIANMAKAKMSTHAMQPSKDFWAAKRFPCAEPQFVPAPRKISAHFQRAHYADRRPVNYYINYYESCDNARHGHKFRPDRPMPLDNKMVRPEPPRNMRPAMPRRDAPNTFKVPARARKNHVMIRMSDGKIWVSDGKEIQVIDFD